MFKAGSKFLTQCVCVALIISVMCMGCSLDHAASDVQSRSVSSEFRGFWKSGLEITNGDLKESGVKFEDSVIEFQDPVIEEMLRTIIGKPEGDVLHTDLLDIHAIYWRTGRYWSNLQSDDGTLPDDGSKWYSSGQPATLADLAYCDNLQWMEFGAFELPSLEPLFALTQLECIIFRQTVVSSKRLEELGQLPALTSLEIDFRDIASDLTGATTGDDQTDDGSFLLALADQLTHLEIKNTFRWSPEVMSQLTKLELLMLDTPQDLSFLPSLTSLQSLYISNCSVTDWSALREAQTLEHLVLLKCKQISLEDLRYLSKLEYLNLVMTELDPAQSRQEIIDAIPSLTGLCIQ